MEEEKIKKILSLYTKTPAHKIEAGTRIDRTAIGSSIMVHRMYAELAKEGLEVAGYWDIEDYNMLLKRLGFEDGSLSNGMQVRLSAPVIPGTNNFSDFNPVGIDIEETVNMPAAVDFREDKFYQNYFSPSEISYCILQPDPLVSFTGLFAVKEAIIKANNGYKNLPFNTIVIDHLPGGKPVHPDFYLSITHTANLAVAVAIQKNIPAHPSSNNGKEAPVPATNLTLLYLVSFSAIILAVITFIMIIIWY